MALIVALTGAIGLLCSYALLHAGITSLSLRYLVASLSAYVAFLFLLWTWVRRRRDDLWDGLDLANAPLDGISSGRVPAPSLEPGGGHFGGAGASGSFEGDLAAGAPGPVGADSAAEGLDISDAVGGLDLDDLFVVIFLIVAVAAGLWAAVSIVWTAPSFLAELLLDAALAGGLYRRLRGVAGDHWLATALRRTALPFAVVAAIFVASGAMMETFAPGADSVGEFFRYVRSGPQQP